MRNLATALLCLLSLSLTACPHGDHTVPESSSAMATNTKTIFVQGDPRALVAGAQMNSRSPITEENIQTWNSLESIGYRQYVEHKEFILPVEKDIKKREATKDTSQPDTSR